MSTKEIPVSAPPPIPERTYTGDIRIHEIAWVEDELWAVNTRFSCLCTFDAEHSFRPVWRPRFISSLAPEDRCHLNGLAMVDGPFMHSRYRLGDDA